MILVTFVTPTYNESPEHVAECIASVREQTHPHVEHVIVDDGSTDKATRQMLAALYGVRMIRQNNAGPAAARNRGAAESSGAILVFLDADDRVSPGYASEAVRTLSDPDVVAAYPAKQCFGAKTLLDDRRDDRTLRSFMSSSGVPVTSAVRRSDFEAIGGFDAELRCGAEDQEFWIRLLLARPGVCRRMEATLFYRTRAGSRSDLVGTADGIRVTRERAIQSAARAGHLEALAGALWGAVDHEVHQRHVVVHDRLYLRPQAARLKARLTRAVRRG